MNEILYLIIVAVASVVALFIIAKILGKRQVAELDFVDYIIGISIGSIAAEMATDINEKPMYYYLIAIGIYFLFDLLLNYLGRKSPWLKRFVKGKPVVVIYEGKLSYQALKKSKLSVNDILSMARSQGYFDILDIAYAVLEDNGNLSILPKGNKRPTVAEDLMIKFQPASLPVYLIVDGRISYSSLNEINKSKDWLIKKLNLSRGKRLKDIILAVYDENKDEIITNYKNETNS